MRKREVIEYRHRIDYVGVAFYLKESATRISC